MVSSIAFKLSQILCIDCNDCHDWNFWILARICKVEATPLHAVYEVEQKLCFSAKIFHNTDTFNDVMEQLL